MPFVPKLAKPRSETQMFQYERSGQWAVWIPSTTMKKGHTKSLRTKDRAEAEKLFRDCKIVDIVHAAKADALTKQFWTRLIVGKDITITKALDEYAAAQQILGRSAYTINSAVKTIDHFIRQTCTGLAPIASLQPKHVTNYVNAMGINFGTRMFRFHRLNSFFTYCHEMNWIPVNPCLNVAVRTRDLTQAQLIQKKKIPFTPDEVERLLKVAPVDSFWHGAILVAKTYGLRLGTVSSLEWTSLPDLKRITVFTHKGRIVVDEPLTPELIAWFGRHPHIGESGFVWPDRAALVMELASGRMSGEFNRLCRKAGITGRCFHCFRSMVVTNDMDRMLDALGGPEKALLTGLLAKHGISAIQKIIGHAAGSSVTTNRYFNPGPIEPPEPGQSPSSPPGTPG